MNIHLLTGAVVALVAFLLVAGLAFMADRRRQKYRQKRVGDEPVNTQKTSAAASNVPKLDRVASTGGDIPFADATTADISQKLYELAFGPSSSAQGTNAEETTILKQVRHSLRESGSDRQYFPRKPMVIPQLFKAMKSNDGAVKELVRIIMQDPVLTGDVLKIANSPYYRTSSDAYDTLDRAIMQLGTDGLRALISSSVLQPVFKVPKGCFDKFSEVIWDQTLKSALAAQVYARRTIGCDNFLAHLTALLSSIGWIVLFRVTVDKYTQSPTIQPQASVFITLLEESADKTSKAIAQNWELAQPVQHAIQEQIDKRPINRLSPIGRALYYGRLCATCALLVQHEKLNPSDARAIALSKGLREKDFDMIWQAILPDPKGSG